MITGKRSYDRTSNYVNYKNINTYPYTSEIQQTTKNNNTITNQTSQTQTTYNSITVGNILIYSNVIQSKSSDNFINFLNSNISITGKEIVRFGDNTNQVYKGEPLLLSMPFVSNDITLTIAQIMRKYILIGPTVPINVSFPSYNDLISLNSNLGIGDSLELYIINRSNTTSLTMTYGGLFLGNTIINPSNTGHFLLQIVSNTDYDIYRL